MQKQDRLPAVNVNLLKDDISGNVSPGIPTQGGRRCKMMFLFAN